MVLLFVTLLWLLSTNFVHPIILNVEEREDDPRFSTSRDYVGLLQHCSVTNSVKHREARKFQFCNPPHEHLGIPMGYVRGPLTYNMQIIGKPNITFTFKEGESSHNVYYENLELSFHAYPGVCKYFYLSNLGDGIKDSRIIYKIEDQSRHYCNQKIVWEEKQKKRNPYPSFIPQGDEAAAKVIEGLFWHIFKLAPPPIPGLEILLRAFWPRAEPCAWDQLKNNVKKEISEANLFRLNSTRNQLLKTYREKLEDLQQAILLESEQIENLVMAISAVFVGQEELVMFEDEVVLSSQLLPIFSTTVALFINFHFWAINFAEKYNFHPKNIMFLKLRRDIHVKYAHDYIMKVYDANMEHAYNTCDLTLNFYDCMVDVHNHIAISGIQYLSMWTPISDYESNDTRTKDVIFYSRSFGTPTLELMKTAIFYPGAEFSRLTPAFNALTQDCNKHPGDSGCLRQNITRIHISYADEQRRISNLTVFYNGEREEVDRKEGNYISLEDGAVITKMVVGGKGCVDYIKFYLSNDFIEPFGYFDNINNVPNVTFEMKNHFIAGISIQNDGEQTLVKKDRQAKNIAVSYRRLNIRQHMFD